MGNQEQGSRVDVYTRVTERIVADLEQGVRPWLHSLQPAASEERRAA